MRIVLVGNSRNNMADVEEKIFLQANLFLLLVLEQRYCQPQNHPQNLFLCHQKIKFFSDFFPAFSLFFFEIFTIAVVDALI